MSDSQYDDSIIKEGDIVLLIENESRYQFPTVSLKTNVKLGKKSVSLEPIIGHKYGAWFELKENKLVLYDPTSFKDEELIKMEEEELKRTNKELFDKNDSQKLTHEQIAELKKKGVDGETLVKQLIENSETFEKKSSFSQQKYIKKKKKKHHICIQVLKPTSNLICKALFEKSPDKIKGLREDALASLVLYSNVRCNSRVILHDKCGGLITTTLLEKMDCKGTIFNVHNGLNPSFATIRLLGIKDDILKNILKSIPIGSLLCNEDELDNQENDDTFKQIQNIKEDLNNLCDSLVIGGLNNPKPVFDVLFKYLKPTGTFVVYSQQLQPLVDIETHLHKNNMACHTRIFENWLRYYQILKDRTHPLMQMSGFGGYLLVGIKLFEEDSSHITNNSNKRRKTDDN